MGQRIPQEAVQPVADPRLNGVAVTSEQPQEHLSNQPTGSPQDPYSLPLNGLVNPPPLGIMSFLFKAASFGSSLLGHI